MFVFGTDRINDDEVGKIVEVDINGKILRYRFDLKEAMDWDEVSEIWGVESHDDLLVDGVWPRGIRWRKLKR